MENFADLNQFIFDEIKEKITKNKDYNEILSKKTFKNYNLVITGSVGVGKSTVAEIISQLLNEKVVKFPEYINLKINNENIGLKMLKYKSEHLIGVDTFQHFILDSWNYILQTRYDKKNDKIYLFERLPEDAFRCFSVESYHNGEISYESLKCLEEKYTMLIDKYNFFEMKDCKFIQIYNDKLCKTVEEILKIINNDIDNKVTHRLIGLNVDEEKFSERIKQRGRESEIKCIDIFKRYQNFYNKLYSNLDENGY